LLIELVFKKSLAICFLACSSGLISLFLGDMLKTSNLMFPFYIGLKVYTNFETASKGVFITTAGFAKPAVDYAKSVPNANIILIDGLTLAKLMIKHDLGVSTSNIIHIKKIDSDYFEDQ
jgi:hypothetical protein